MGGRIQDFLYSGLTAEESRQFAEFPNGMLFFEQLSRSGEPLRLRNFHGYVRELGLPEFRPPMAVSSPLPFLAAPLRHQGEGVGGIYVGEKDVEFTPEDEETLVNTTPVGVLVHDARTGVVVSLNREARRIVSGLCAPGGSAEQLWSRRMSRNRRARELRVSHRASAPPWREISPYGAGPPGTPAIIPSAWAAAAPGFVPGPAGRFPGPVTPSSGEQRPRDRRVPLPRRSGPGMPAAAAAWAWIRGSASPMLRCTVAPTHHLPGSRRCRTVRLVPSSTMNWRRRRCSTVTSSAATRSRMASRWTCQDWWLGAARRASGSTPIVGPDNIHYVNWTCATLWSGSSWPRWTSICSEVTHQA